MTTTVAQMSARVMAAAAVAVARRIVVDMTTAKATVPPVMAGVVTKVEATTPTTRCRLSR
jgi:hypothetical protein